MPKPIWLDKFQDLWLFDDLKNYDKKLNLALTKVIIGQFYEVLGATIFNGDYGKPYKECHVYPDVIVWDKKRQRDILIETKAGCKDFIIDVGQIREYEKLAENSFPYEDAEIYYMFFIHDLIGITKKYVFVNNLIEALSINTLACVMVPVNMVKKFTEWIPLYKYHGWITGSRGGPGHENFMRMRHRRIKEWTKGTVGCVKKSIIEMAVDAKEEFKLNGYVFKKHFIVGAEILGYEVCDFPLITMYDKKGWKCRPCLITK